MSAGDAPAGYYPDPLHERAFRYWSGSEWGAATDAFPSARASEAPTATPAGDGPILGMAEVAAADATHRPRRGVMVGGLLAAAAWGMFAVGISLESAGLVSTSVLVLFLVGIRWRMMYRRNRGRSLLWRGVRIAATDVNAGMNDAVKAVGPGYVVDGVVVQRPRPQYQFGRFFLLNAFLGTGWFLLCMSFFPLRDSFVELRARAVAPPD